MGRRRGKSTKTPIAITLSLLVLAVGVSWWVFLRGTGVATSRPSVTLAALSAQPALGTEEIPKSPSSTDALKPEIEKPAATPETASNVAGRMESLIAAGKQELGKNNPLGARSSFGEALSLGPTEPELALLRRELAKLGEEMIFSPRMYENDPLVSRYVLQPGDTLAKVATENRVTADLLADVNHIGDKNLIRAGQTIKILKGPFHAVVDKKSYLLDLYLGEVFVAQFHVGLGADDSTPNGKWRVSSKLTNPTYYPPRGGAIMAADDPKNPLGERWIGLTGIEGNALGQERYGIHGTIEPESIGKSTSMGCIRMRNEDVEELYECLVEKHSTVTVR